MVWRCPSVRPSALSGWVLYRQLELTQLTHPDLHHVVGLFILKVVRLLPRKSIDGISGLFSNLVCRCAWVSHRLICGLCEATTLNMHMVT